MFHSFAKLASGASTVGEFPLDGLANLTGGWSLSRVLLTDYTGPLFNQQTGFVDIINDQSGNAFDFIQTNPGLRPAQNLSTGNQNRAAAEFDGVDDFLEAGSLSNFITDIDGYVITSVIVNQVFRDNGTAIQNNDAVIADANGFFGNFMRSTGPVIQSFIFDGFNRETGDVLFSLSTAVIFELRLEGGFVSCRVNGQNEQSIATANMASVGGETRMAINSSDQVSDFTIFEAATFSISPSLAERDQLVVDFLNHIN